MGRLKFSLDNTTAYPKSKAMAEKEVWDFHSKLPEDDRFDVVTINPGFIQGPILSKLHLYFNLILLTHLEQF